MGPSRIRLHCATTGALSRAHFYMPRKLKKSACLASLEESATQPAASPRGACVMNQVRTHRTPAPRPSFSQEMRVKQKKEHLGTDAPCKGKAKTRSNRAASLRTSQFCILHNLEMLPGCKCPEFLAVAMADGYVCVSRGSLSCKAAKVTIHTK